ncbi:MAG: aldehyde ferredoxin oxidoreductase family protein [Pseudomonadota bacterium]
MSSDALFGWQGRILRVDLSSGKIEENALESADRENFLGGRGIGVKWVYDHGMVEALSPQNLLVFAAGPLTGTGALTSGRAAAVSKSPLTGTICSSNAGGSFGVHLKRSGIDAIVIEGNSSEPVWLEISDGRPALRSARGLWGRNTRYVFDALKHFKAVLCIGRAGENRVLLSSIMHNRSHAFGRGGLGAVMGAKRLKAIAVSGKDAVRIADRVEFALRQKNLSKILLASPVLKSFSSLGTPSLLKVLDWAGILPVSNFRKCGFAGADEISAESLKRLHPSKSRACISCPVGCKKETLNGSSLPEYETIAMFGSNHENADLCTIIELNRLCNDYGLDTVSTGSTLACFSEAENRKPGTEELCELVKNIGESEGIGVVLGQGSLRYSLSRNKKAASVAVKGLETPAYDPRGAYGLGLAYGTANRGGCHLGAYMIAPEILRKPKALRPLTFSGKASYLAVLQNTFAAVDSLIVCKFAYVAAGQEEYANLLSAVTGESFAADDLTRIGERIWTLERLYNLREGFQRIDDYLPERFYEEAENHKGIDRAEYDDALSEYYSHRGWNNEGIPEKAKLKELGLED